MSLINDALKKVSGNKSKSPQPRLNFAQPVYRFGHQKHTPKIFVVIGILLSLLAIAFVCIWLIKNREESSISFLKTKKPDKVVTSTNIIGENTIQTGRTTKVAETIKSTGDTNAPSAISNYDQTSTSFTTATLQNTNVNIQVQIAGVKKNYLNEESNKATIISKNQQSPSSPVQSKQTDIKQIVRGQTEEKSSSLKIIPTQFPELKINGIFYQKSRPSAIINGKIVFIGDEILGAKIISIERESVTVEFKGEKRIFKM